jgi:hypothetical protein
MKGAGSQRLMTEEIGKEIELVALQTAREI